MSVSDKAYTFVQAGESAVTSAASPTPALAATGLDADIAVTCYNPASRTVGIARLADAARLRAFIETVIGASGGALPLCEVRLVGGAEESAESPRVLALVKLLEQADDGRDVLNLVSCAVGAGQYPRSFRLTALDGHISPL